MRRRGSERSNTGIPRGRRGLRHTGGSGLNSLTLLVDLFTIAIVETTCAVTKPAPGRLEGGDFCALGVRRGLRCEAGWILRCYEHAAVVCIVAFLVRWVAAISRRVATEARTVAAVTGGVASFRVRGGAISHGMGWLVRLDDRPRLAGAPAGRRDGG